ncbi:oligosaccharide flippase family protein [Brevibacillus sp. B_LB10_24]|uniref:oligosaccharide flippase family protein n=1 Tax=Brevibacillus sp. B_LB10_24 TaxID=3380645 RepID=UPI0038B8470C
MLSRLKNSTLARNTLWMVLGQGSRILIQAVYFIIIARCLGAEGYGTFVGVASLVGIFAPFSTWGTGNLLVKHVSRDKGVFPQYWGNALAMTVISGVLLTLLTGIVAQFTLPVFVSPLLILAISVSDLIFYRLLDVSSQAFQAFERLKRTAQLQVFLSLARLVGAAALALFSDSRSPAEWAVIYLCTTVIGAAVGVWLVNRELGTPRVEWRKLFAELREGFYFSVSSSSVAIYNDTSKILLVNLSTLEASGIFAAAGRIIEVSLSPIRALMGAAYAKFFQDGRDGIAGSLRLAKRLLSVSVVYSVIAGICIYAAAPVLPWLLGEDYSNAVDAVRFLAVVPLLKSMYSFAQDALTGAGYQGWRSGIQVIVAVINPLTNLLLIPLYSWRGAALAGMASDLLLSLGYWLAIWYFYRRDNLLKVKAHIAS